MIQAFCRNNHLEEEVFEQMFGNGTSRPRSFGTHQQGGLPVPAIAPSDPLALLKLNKFDTL
jgi:hypothetical protein